MKNLDVVRDNNGHALADENGNIRREFRQIEPFSTRKIVYTCKRHGEIPCEVAIFNGELTQPYCPICEAEKEKEMERQEAVRREAAAKQALLERYKEMNIEEEYWNKTVDDFEPLVPSQAKAKAAVQKLIERKHGKVILLGSNGSGKSHLGNCAVKALGGKVYTMYELSAMIRQAYSPLAKKTELEIVSELASVPLLFIDEVGRSKGSAAELNWMSYVFDKRHQRNLPFFLAGNGHLMRDCPHGKQHCEECFENFLGNDIISRLGQDTEIVTMYDAPDYRRGGIKNGKEAYNGR